MLDLKYIHVSYFVRKCFKYDYINKVKFNIYVKCLGKQ